MNRDARSIDLQKLLRRLGGRKNSSPSPDDTSPELRKWLELAEVMLDSDAADPESELDPEAA